MSGLPDIGKVNEAVENIGTDHHLSGEMPQPSGGGGDSRPHPPLWGSRKAIRELVSALEQDGDSWQSEREAWANERALLQGKLEYKEKYVVMLKKETKRLSRVIGDIQLDSARMEMEASRLRDEKSNLLARNARLNERNLEVRRQAETLAERNRKLKATLERELLGNVDLNSASSKRGDGEGSNKREAAAAAVDRKPFDSAAATTAAAAPSTRLTEQVRSILVPNPRSRPADTVAVAPSDRSTSSSSSSSSRSTRRRRKAPPRGDHSDTEEIITPKSSAPGGDYESMGAALAAAAAARVGPSKTAIRRGGGVVNGWRVAVEEVEAAESSRRRGGASAGASSLAPTLPLRRGTGGEYDERGGEPLAGGSSGGPVVKREAVGTSGGGAQAVDRWGRGSLPSIGGNAAGDSDVPRQTRPRSESRKSSDTGNEGGDSRGGSRGDSTRDGRFQTSSGNPGNGTDRGPDSLRHPRSSEMIRRDPVTHPAAPASTHGASEEGSRPAELTWKPYSSSSSSGRKRSRLSLGGRAADDGRPHTAAASASARSIEVTEVLEAPRPRSTAAAAAAAAEAEARRAPPDPPAMLGSSRSPMSSPGKLRSRGVDEIMAGTTRRGDRDDVGAPWDGIGGRGDAGVLKSECSNDGRLKGKARDYGTPDRDCRRQDVFASRTAAPAAAAAAATRGGGEEGTRGVVGVFDGSGSGSGCADSSCTASTGTAMPAGEVTYPCLTMAVVKTSPKKKKRGSRRPPPYQHQHQQDVATVHRPRSSSNDSRSYGRQNGDQPASAGASGRSGVRRQRSRPAGASEEQGGSVAGDGRSGKGWGMDADHPEGEGDHPSSQDLVGGNGNDLGTLRRSRGDLNEGVDEERCTTGGDSGDAEDRGPPDEGEAAGDLAPAIGQHQRVPNPYASEAFRGGGGQGGSRERPRANEKRPAVGYKFQEVVRDRSKRAMMKGHDCEHCMAYLAAVGGSPGEREAMLNMCSRHRYTEANGRPAETPEGFWDLSFADSINPDKELQQQRWLRERGTGKNGKADGDDCSLGF